MQTKHQCVLIHMIGIKGEFGTVKLVIKPSSNFLTDRSKAVLFLWILFVICICLCHTAISVSCSLMVTCWERADLLALLCVMFSCVLSLSHNVSWVRCGT